MEEDASGQEEETEGQRGEREGKEIQTHTKIIGQELIKALRGKKRRRSDKEKKWNGDTIQGRNRLRFWVTKGLLYT